MKADKIIKIFQNVGYYEGWENYQNLPKIGYYEGWEDDQNLPKDWLL